MANPPRLSVCIPVYNPGPYLGSCIASVLAQDYPNYELILVDDASTQPVEDIVTQHADGRLRFYRNPRNLGLVGNWNRCFELATGAYVTLFHQDDLMRPGNLSRKVAMLETWPDAGFVYSNIETMDASGVVVGGHWLPQPSADKLWPGHTLYTELALKGNFISCPSVMVRAAAYHTCGPYDARLPFTCDLEMWLRLAGRYDAGYLSAPLIASRTHAQQATRDFTGGGREIREVRKAFAIVFHRPMPAGVNPALPRLAERNLLRWSVRMARWDVRRGRLRSAFGYLAAGLAGMERGGEEPRPLAGNGLAGGSAP